MILIGTSEKRTLVSVWSAHVWLTKRMNVAELHAVIIFL